MTPLLPTNKVPSQLFAMTLFRPLLPLAVRLWPAVLGCLGAYWNSRPFVEAAEVLAVRPYVKFV